MAPHKKQWWNCHFVLLTVTLFGGNNNGVVAWVRVGPPTIFTACPSTKKHSQKCVPFQHDSFNLLSARSRTSALSAALSSSTAPSEKSDITSSSSTENLGFVSGQSASKSEQAVTTLASTIIAMLAGDEISAVALGGGAAKKKQMIHSTFEAYDVCESGILSIEEAQALFTNLARSIVTELASSDTTITGAGINKTTTTASNTKMVAKAHAQRVLADDEAGDTIARVATKLLLLADADGDGRISLPELAAMFETVYNSNTIVDDINSAAPQSIFPKPLRALAGSLQLLPPIEGTNAAAASDKTSEWNLGVPGDDHTLRHVSIGKGLSLIGLGRSADASAYFLPELGLVLDAGIHVKSLQPKTVLLTHGHRDHIAALPTHAQAGATMLVPADIAPLVRRFLLAEAQLNYGDPTQTDEETIVALGDFNIQPVHDGMEILLPKSAYTGSPTPLGIQVFTAPHKIGVPAVSYGIYRSKNRLKQEYAHLPKNELGALLRNSNNTISITETYTEGLLFYTGDTTIKLLRERWKEILPKYKYIIHEVTFLGMPSSKMDASSQLKGHTHYAQLHPWISAFPETTFICVHWSLRYSKKDILNFFEEQYGGVPKNVVLWV